MILSWLTNSFHKYPELAVFLVVGMGYWIGGFKYRGFGLGPVTGSLIAGALLGYFFHIEVSAAAKSILFLLFLFSIGYSVGPKFFQSMKGDGLKWALFAIVTCCTGLGTAYVVAHLLHLDTGFAAGLLSGALTESPAIGTASDAINALPLPADERARLVSHVAVADSLCYIFGAFGVIVFCGDIGPKLLGLNLRAEAQKLENALGIDRRKPGVTSAWHPYEMRAYRIKANGLAVGKTIAELENSKEGVRLFVERLRRGEQILEPTPEIRLEVGDIVVVSGRREVLVEITGDIHPDEVEDRELLDIPTASYGVFVTSKKITGKTLEQIAQNVAEVRSVFLINITRQQQKIPIAPQTIIERGDVLLLSGPVNAVTRIANLIGKIVLPTDSTDFVALCLGIFSGALIGSMIIIPLGSLHIVLGTSVGTLVAGLLTGYLHSTRPLFGRIPDGAILLMNALGLAAFVGMVGISAGPHFVDALRAAGVSLFFGGMVVTLTPLIVGLYFGVYVLKLNPLLVLGGLAGAQTMTPGLARVQERSDSPVAVLGYSGAVAVGHVLLTTWGTVIVWLMSAYSH